MALRQRRRRRSHHGTKEEKRLGKKKGFFFLFLFFRALKATWDCSTIFSLQHNDRSKKLCTKMPNGMCFSATVLIAISSFERHFH